MLARAAAAQDPLRLTAVALVAATSQAHGTAPATRYGGDADVYEAALCLTNDYWWCP